MISSRGKRLNDRQFRPGPEPDETSALPKLSLHHAERLARFAIPAIAVIVRLAFGLSRLQEIPVDPDHYVELASSLISGQGFVYDGRPTAYRPPLYPIVIAPLVALFGQGRAFHASLVVFQAMLGGATTYFAMQAPARAVSSLSQHAQDDAPSAASPKWFAASIVTGALTALDPVLVSQTSLVMTETLAAFLLTGAGHAIMHARYRQAGLWFGVSALCRPSLLACMLLAVISRAIPTGTDDAKRRFGAASRMTVFCCILLLPWGLRNQIRFGEPVLTTTHGGYTLALANNQIYYEDVVFGPAGAVWSGPRQQAWMDSIGTDTVGLPEPEADRRIKAKAVRFIREHPGDFAIACIHRQLRFWSVAPSAQVFGQRVRALCALWTIPFWLLVLISLRLRSTWTWPVMALLAMSAALAIVHCVYWTDIRMRAPIVPTLAILAGIGAESVLRGIKR